MEWRFSFLSTRNTKDRRFVYEKYILPRYKPQKASSDSLENLSTFLKRIIPAGVSKIYIINKCSETHTNLWDSCGRTQVSYTFFRGGYFNMSSSCHMWLYSSIRDHIYEERERKRKKKKKKNFNSVASLFSFSYCILEAITWLPLQILWQKKKEKMEF